MGSDLSLSGRWEGLAEASMTGCVRFLSRGVVALGVAGVQAAPLDGFLEASPYVEPRTGFFEVALDAMNGTLDVLNLRPDGLADDTIGNLDGFHLRAGYALTADLWVDGSLYRRKITYAGIDPELTSWQLGAQYRYRLSSERYRSDAAVRLSMWGSHAGEIAATRGQLQSRPVFRFLDGLSVDRPADRQIQGDLLWTWWLGSTALSAFAGAGLGEVSVRSVTARLGSVSRRWLDGRFVSEAGQVDNLLAGLVEQLGLEQELDSINYSTRFVHGGVGLRIPYGDWSVRAAYQVFTIRRNTVDELISARESDNATYRMNHTLIGEISYRFTGRARVFVRGQAMSNQFLSEMPLLYNSLTVQRFGEKYGIVSVGLVMGF
jgi:hypothetical protein